MTSFFMQAIKTSRPHVVRARDSVSSKAEPPAMLEAEPR